MLNRILPLVLDIKDIIGKDIEIIVWFADWTSRKFILNNYRAQGNIEIESLEVQIEPD